MKTLIHGGTIINERQAVRADLVVADDCIAAITETNTSLSSYDDVVDAEGCFVIPGIIDTHVHFREPGLEEKADIASESRAAAYGGVTSYCEMPNTVPQTTTLEALNDKYERAARESYVNYSFFFGATNDNYTIFPQLDRHRIPGIKLFMGSSTGNMLVDKYGSLLKIFQTAAQVDLPVMTHCEDTDIINHQMAQMKKAYGDDPPVMLHPLIRTEEACYDSSALAVQLARTFGTQLHIAHISTAKELGLLEESDAPHSTLHSPQHIEKRILRQAFADMLPEAVAWRQKEQFSDGVGYSWIDTLKEMTEQAVSDEQMAHAAERFPINTPMNKEEYYYRSIFAEHFPSDSAARSVPHEASVACSTAVALEWDEAFKRLNEPSGRAVKGVHEQAY